MSDEQELDLQYPIVATDKLLEDAMVAYSEEWGDYAILYPHLVELFNLSPTMAIGPYRGVPTISVEEMVTFLKRRCPEQQLLIDEDSVCLLATIFSWKTGAVITQQFIHITPDLPLMAFILEEEGCFD